MTPHVAGHRGQGPLPKSTAAAAASSRVRTSRARRATPCLRPSRPAPPARVLRSRCTPLDLLPLVAVSYRWIALPPAAIGLRASRIVDLLRTRPRSSSRVRARPRSSTAWAFSWGRRRSRRPSCVAWSHPGRPSPRRTGAAGGALPAHGGGARGAHKWRGGACGRAGAARPRPASSLRYNNCTPKTKWMCGLLRAAVGLAKGPAAASSRPR